MGLICYQHRNKFQSIVGKPQKISVVSRSLYDPLSIFKRKHNKYKSTECRMFSRIYKSGGESLHGVL